MTDGDRRTAGAVVLSQAPRSTGLQWYCLRSQPKHEGIAAVHLRKLAAIEVFCPRVRFQRLRRTGNMGTGKTWATEAMFPGYLFALFEFEARYREIQSTHGVSGIVRFGSKLVSIPEPVIAQLRDAVGSGELATVSPPPTPGGEVTVTGGALNGLQAIVTHYLPTKQRVRVLLEFMGRELEAEVSESGVVAPFAHPLRNF